MLMESVYIVLVNYNDSIYIERCLDSLYKQDYDNVHIVVVDNFSVDGSIDIIEKHRDIILKKLDDNIGWGAASNVGIKMAIDKGADYIMLLNTDVYLEKSAVRTMVNNCDSTSIVAPLMYRGDINGIDCENPDCLEKWYAGGMLTKYADSNSCVFSEAKDNMEVEFITGCCMFIPRNVIDIVGLIDEKFFLYYEDMDYCIRARKKGVKLIYSPNTYLIHAVGGSQGGEMSPISMYYVMRNRLYMSSKYEIFESPEIVLKKIYEERSGEQLLNNSNYVVQAQIDFFNGQMGKKNIKIGNRVNIIYAEGFRGEEEYTRRTFNWVTKKCAVVNIVNYSEVDNYYRITFSLQPYESDIKTCRVYVDGMFVDEIKSNEFFGEKICIKARGQSYIKIDVLDEVLENSLIYRIVDFDAQQVSDKCNTTDITKEDVEWAYYKYLKRGCEDEAAMNSKIALKNFHEMIKDFTYSDEFKKLFIPL